MKYIKNTVTLRFDFERCVGCKRCTEVCPHHVFVMKDKKAVITDRDRCMECGACMKNCAYGAISVDAGVGCAAAIIYGMINKTEPSCDCSSESGCC